MSGFRKAMKEKLKLRAALFGPSGAGKTYTALRMAQGLGGTVAVIDTERRSASKYADRFSFDVLDLEDRSIEGYVRAIKEARAYDVLIVDSLSHAWQELVAEVDRLTQAKYKNNSWSAWSEGTPKQRQLVDAILAFPGHVLATMRSKTEWAASEGRNGKTAPVRVGLAPEQGKGIEYEFDLLLELSTDHVGRILKDRTGKFQDKTIDKPGEDFGAALGAWLDEGEAAPGAGPTARAGKGAAALGAQHADEVDACESIAELDEVTRRRPSFLPARVIGVLELYEEARRAELRGEAAIDDATEDARGKVRAMREAANV
jgi:hypothetical protein